MANEKRLIDANALADNWFYTNDTGTKVVELLEIEQAPTVDAVEVVRCINCKHHEIFDNLPYCNHTRGLAGSVSPDGYCYLGEREDNGSE